MIPNFDSSIAQIKSVPMGTKDQTKRWTVQVFYFGSRGNAPDFTPCSVWETRELRDVLVHIPAEEEISWEPRAFRNLLSWTVWFEFPPPSDPSQAVIREA